MRTVDNISITEVWPRVWVGSGLVPDPEAFVRSTGVRHVVIASPSAYREGRWHLVRESLLARVQPLYFRDGPLDAAAAFKLALRVADVPHAADYPVAFLCYGGVNRSSLLACMYRWANARPMEPMRHVVRQLRDARREVNPLGNSDFAAFLDAVDEPLHAGARA